MTDNSATKWKEGWRFVQFMKNRSYRAGIKRSLYEALFSYKPRIGLQLLSLPDIILKTLQTEEEPEKVISSSRCTPLDQQFPTSFNSEPSTSNNTVPSPKST